MRKPGSAYFKGRSTDLVKLKVLKPLVHLYMYYIFIFEKAVRGDMEGLVVKIKKQYIRLQLYFLFFILLSTSSKITSPRPNGSFLNVDRADVRIPHGEGETGTGGLTGPNSGEENEGMVREGAIVSFSYVMSAQRNQPAQPMVYRVRRDLHWRDVLRSYHSENNALPLNGMYFELSVQGTI